MRRGFEERGEDRGEERRIDVEMEERIRGDR